MGRVRRSRRATSTPCSARAAIPAIVPPRRSRPLTPAGSSSASTASIPLRWRAGEPERYGAARSDSLYGLDPVRDGFELPIVRAARRRRRPHARHLPGVPGPERRVRRHPAPASPGVEPGWAATACHRRTRACSTRSSSNRRASWPQRHGRRGGEGPVASSSGHRPDRRRGWSPRAERTTASSSPLSARVCGRRRSNGTRRRRLRKDPQQQALFDALADRARGRIGRT